MFIAGVKKDTISAKLDSVLGLRVSADENEGNGLAALRVDCDDAELLLLEMGYEVSVEGG